MLLVDTGRHPEALALLDRAAERGLRGREVRDVRAAALSFAGRHDEALDAATRLLALARLVASSHTTLARVLLAGGDRVGALRALVRTLEPDPGAIGAAQQLFVLAREQNDAAAALLAGGVLEKNLAEAQRVALDVELALLRATPEIAETRFARACLDAVAPESEVVAAYEALS